MNTVIDQPQFAIHVFARESEPIFFPHIAFRRVRPPYGRYSYSARRPRASPKREVTFFIAS
ncbi:hypothetical protein, partial [Akkermansia muciniphila]|uniref:hypothetical protein n=1 Tax=Akkermansia muciniphila TaxID=239935 RepID=UPI001C9B8E9C